MKQALIFAFLASCLLSASVTAARAEEAVVLEKDIPVLRPSKEKRPMPIGEANNPVLFVDGGRYQRVIDSSGKVTAMIDLDTGREIPPIDLRNKDWCELNFGGDNIFPRTLRKGLSFQIKTNSAYADENFASVAIKVKKPGIFAESFRCIAALSREPITSEKVRAITDSAVKVSDAALGTIAFARTAQALKTLSASNNIPCDK